MPVVARLAEALGLPGPPSAAVDAARDKHLTRAAMKAAGLPSPACKRVEDASDLDEAARVVGFPAVLKPLNGAASLGVKKVQSRADLEQCYADVLAEMRDTVVSSGALVKKDPSSPGASEDEKIAFLMEEYKWLGYFVVGLAITLLVIFSIQPVVELDDDHLKPEGSPSLTPDSIMSDPMLHARGHVDGFGKAEEFVQKHENGQRAGGRVGRARGVR